MRADVKSELQMLRELVWYAYATDKTEQRTKICSWKFCYFCRGPLLDLPEDMTFGHRRHPRVDVDITLHHIDENRENNDSSNLAPCHDSCHRSHHAKKRAAYRKEVVKQYESRKEETTQEVEKETLLTPKERNHAKPA